MRFRVSSQGPEVREVILEIEGTKFLVDPQATSAIYAAPRHMPEKLSEKLEKQVDVAKRLFPAEIQGSMDRLGLHIADLAKDFSWPACGWFPATFRTYQNHLFAFHLVGRPTDGTDQHGGEWRWSFANAHGDKPITLRVERSRHPDRSHLLVLLLDVPGVPCT